MESQQIYLCHDYYDLYNNGYFHWGDGIGTYEYCQLDINRIFFYHRRRFETAGNDAIKRTYLEKMIFDAVYSRDFVILKELIGKYRTEFDAYASEYITFFTAVTKLIERIKEFMAQYRENDCVMFWIDNLEYGMDQDMLFLKGIDQDAMVFENMYTVTPYTTATLKTLLQNKRIYEKGRVNGAEIDRECSFIKKLNEREYEFEYYGGKKLSLSRELCGNFPAGMYEHFSRICWFYLKERTLSCEKNKKWVILHELPATHVPFISMGLKGKKYAFVPFRKETAALARQRDESRAYIDKELEFYSDLLPENCLKIYMSDHGQSLLGRFHVIFKMKKKGILPQKREELVSYEQFDKIVLSVMDGKPIDFKKVECEYVNVLDIDYREPKKILRAIKTKEIRVGRYFAYHGILTKEDMLIVYRNGMELYQKHVNDEKMVTDERLDWLRSRNRKEYVDTKSQPGFIYANVYLNGFENCMQRTKDKTDRKINTIRSVFENLSSAQRVLLAEGGYESLRLLMLLDETQRRKITYVLDENENCEAGKLGIKVIKAEELKNYEIDIAVVLSFQNRQALINALDANKIICIDLYEEMKKNGANCTKEFYEPEYVEKDFDMRAFDKEAVISVVITEAKEFVSAQDKLILYGTGNDSEIIYDAIEKENVIFCDKKAENSEYKFKGKRVIAPQTLFKEYKDYAVLVTTSVFAGEIYAELIKNGIAPEKIWCNKTVLRN